MKKTEQLVVDATRGDRAAVDALLERFLPGLRAFVRLRAGAMIRAKESVSDLVQSVCREVLENVDQFRYGGEAGFRQWLYTAALRKIGRRWKYYKADKRDAAREVPLDRRSSADDEESRLLEAYRSFYTPSHHAGIREELARLEDAFEKLPPDYQEVIVLARIVGLSREEIGQQMGRSEGAVRTLLSRALAQLAESVQ
jgi:RNA polymerase sigma-70 factor (ECF subfamily)